MYAGRVHEPRNVGAIVDDDPRIVIARDADDGRCQRIERMARERFAADLDQSRATLEVSTCQIGGTPAGALGGRDVDDCVQPRQLGQTA
jgi:hypothetical protein